MCYFCSNIPLDKEMDSDLKVKLESEIYIGRAGELLPGLLPSGRVVALSDANIDRRYRKLLGGYEHVLIGTGETVCISDDSRSLCTRWKRNNSNGSCRLYQPNPRKSIR